MKNIIKSIIFCFILFHNIALATWEDEAMIPFWQGNTIYNESMLLVSYNGGVPESPFLFPYINIISVKNSALDTTYIPGVDWMFQNNKLILPTGSRIPFMKDTEIPFSTNTDPALFHKSQVAVTYTHNGTWQGPVPKYEINKLSNTISKLKNKQLIKIVLYGDSISVGHNASKLLNIQPYLPSWGELLVNTLQKTYNSPITFINQSIGGKKSDWGVQNIHNLVSNQSPDLVIIAFGMNDGVNVPPVAIPIDVNTFKNNLQTMINDVKGTNPNAEFILISTTLANPAYVGSIQSEYKTVMKDLIQTGVTMVDMTSVHQELLKTKKFVDLTGNNVNHPNDYLSRWYAQQLFTLFQAQKTTMIDFGIWKTKYILGQSSLVEFGKWKEAYLQSN